MTPSLPLLKINNLSIGFSSGGQEFAALKNISLEIKQGELVALVGESGSGKSITALSVLKLLPVPPARYINGEILFSSDGESAADLLRLPPHEITALRGNKIAMIFQEPMTSLNPLITCGEQVIESILQHWRISKAAARAQTLELFERVRLPNPAAMLNRYPHQLSGGQQQRVMIAMAMSCNPALLIADEPTTALDATVQKTILQLLKEIQQESNIGVLFITHDLGIVREIADQVAVLYKGEIVEKGATSHVFSQPVHPYTRALLACRPALYPKGARLPVVQDFLSEGPLSLKTDIAPLDVPMLAASIPDLSVDPRLQGNKISPDNAQDPTGHSSTNPKTPIDLSARAAAFQSLKSPAASSVTSTNSPILEVKNLSVWFPSHKSLLRAARTYTKAVDNVSFAVNKGEILGLVGESGCGKTTLGRTLLGLTTPISGSIRFKGQEMTVLSPASRRPFRRELQLIFQDPYSSLNPSLTIGQSLMEPLQVHGLFRNATQRREKVIEMLKKVNLLPEHFNRYPHEFSGGQRQRIVIARALILDPTFIVCDESVSALDVSVQAQVLNLLNDLKKEMDFTAIFISHDLSVVRYLSDRIMVMNKGKIVEEGVAETVYNHPSSDYTRALIAAIPG